MILDYPFGLNLLLEDAFLPKEADSWISFGEKR